MKRLYFFLYITVSFTSLGQAQDMKKKPVADPFSGPDFQALVRKAEPLDTTESLKLFDVPDGFRMELVVASPNIGQPMNLAFDERGRMWVTSTLEYPYPAPLGQAGRDTIKILEDSNGDGAYDKLTTFADGLNIPTGIYPYRDGVIAWSIPNIWFLRDTDGDGRADKREKLYGPLGYERDTHGMQSSFTRGLDGWLHLTHGFNNTTTINATDGSGANCHMSSMGICALLTRMGYSMILQMSCRDRNRISMQGDVLGAAAMGVANILCLSGDGVQSGDHPEAKPVFDMDSISALAMVRHMRDNSAFLSGRKLSSPPQLFMGGAANPFAPPLDFRPQRLAKKVAAGAQFVQTQYCFDIEQLKLFMAKTRDMGLHEKVFILPGVGPMASAKSAEWIRKNVAGVHIPDSVIKRLAGAKDQKQEGVDLCIDLMQQIQEIEGVSGIHLMAYRQEHRIGEIVTKSKVLGTRVPWSPADS